MIRRYIFCRGTSTTTTFSNNIVKINIDNDLETIYVNTGPTSSISILPSLEIRSGNLVVPIKELTTSGTFINLATIYDAGTFLQPGVLDDGNVPIPMGGMVFNFFGTNYSTNMFWNSNNAIIFGVTNPFKVSISYNTARAILLGNYDRLLKNLSYINNIKTDYSITTLYPQFYNYYTDNINTATVYTWRIRLIKQNTFEQKQYIEVCVGGYSTVPDTGYSGLIHTYPSGINTDSNGEPIDQTKTPFDITDGVSFKNPCNSFFGLRSPLVNTSFVFSSDSTGSNWVFKNNSYVNI
jgi:esterase/lipase superfamily enzyme